MMQPCNEAPPNSPAMPLLGECVFPARVESQAAAHELLKRRTLEGDEVNALDQTAMRG
jgi:hypothetical protein